MTPTMHAETGASRFRAALLDVCQKLEDREPFALSRFGEGELGVLQRQWFDDAEYSSDPQDASCSASTAWLSAAFRYKHPSYFVGIPCPHCDPRNFAWSVKESEQDVAQLTFASLFCNANHTLFLNDVMPQFSKYEVILICNRAADITGLPFNVTKDFRIGRNAWRDDLAIIHELKVYVDKRSPAGLLFLFAAGPLSNMAIHELHRHHPSNTYLDIGSGLDTYFYGKSRVMRGYLIGDDLESCDWTPADFAALSGEQGGLAVDIPQVRIESLDSSAFDMWLKITGLLRSGCQRFNEDGDGVGRPRIFYSEDRMEKLEIGLTCLGSGLLRLALEGDHLRSGKSNIPSNRGIVIRRAYDRGDRFMIERDSETSVLTLAEVGSSLLSPIFHYVETLHDPVKSQR